MPDGPPRFPLPVWPPGRASTPSPSQGIHSGTSLSAGASAKAEAPQHFFYHWSFSLARTILEGRTVLVIGTECAPGRAAAQQLSRAGCKVLIASRNEEHADELALNLQKKGGDLTVVVLPDSIDDAADVIRRARDASGHLHMVVNAWAMCYQDDADAGRYRAEARKLDNDCDQLLSGRGPLKMLTLWSAAEALPEPVRHDAWHGYVVVGPVQRLDTEMVDQIDAASGVMHVRAGALADSIVCLMLLPPSARPATLRIDAVPSTEKKK